MSISTTGIINKDISYEDVLDFIASNIDNDAELIVFDGLGASRIMFDYKGEQRELCCVKDSNKGEECSYPFLSTPDYMWMSLNQWGSNIQIMETILKAFGDAWIQRSDVDETGYEKLT